jgi:TPR repeat protein
MNRGRHTPQGPSASTDAAAPAKTSAADLVSPSPEASTPAPATPPADKLAASPPAPAKPVADAAQAADLGQYDLTMAEQYLSGSNVPRNSRTAARWLWAAVKKGNVTAEVALSDLYVTGEGVEKNCEQARILLQAAAKKGNATAAEKLHAADNYGLCANTSSIPIPMSSRAAIP